MMSQANHCVLRWWICCGAIWMIACDESQGRREIEESLNADWSMDQSNFGVALDQSFSRDVGFELPTSFSDPIENYDPLSFVNPFLATGGLGAEIASVSPGASAPNGLTLIGPDTRKIVMIPPYHCAGYHYPDTHIQGFSHTHAHGMGVVDYGAISVLPRLEWKEEYLTFEGRQAPFTHEEEWASPGRYGVVLQDDQTIVDIVATEHGAHHRYSFAEEVVQQQPVVIVDLSDNLETTQTAESRLVITQADQVLIYQRLNGAYSRRFDGVQHFAVMHISPMPLTYQGWSEAEGLREGTEFSGRETGVVFTFPQGTRDVDIRVALSFVDWEGAELNLETELPDLDFEARLDEVESLWRTHLTKIKVRGDVRDVRRFTTAHYHSLLMPSLNSDVDGRYRGLDQNIHHADYRYYSDLSLWDTFRTLHSFYLLVHPELQLDILKSLVQMYEDGGSLPRWPLAHGYTGGMVGTPATQVFAESALKQLTDWDQNLAYEASLAQVTGTARDSRRAGLQSYTSLGWVPADEHNGSVSRTLEFAWSDASLARWADHLGYEEEAAELYQLSHTWKNHWDDEQQFMVARGADGQFLSLPSATRWMEYYVEGNAWHYVWYVPYDVEGMIDVQHAGNRDAFISRLNDYWLSVYAEEDDLLPDDYYWHGNEPVLHYAWLGSLAGDHQLTVEASHHILDTRYGHLPQDGLDGNDDSGTLSAWYMWAAIGLYPIAGTDQYAVGAPIFDRIEIWASQHDIPGSPLVIEAAEGGWHRLPQSVSSRGIELVNPVLTHNTLKQGLMFTY